MNGPETVVVVGLGEVGRPLLELVSKCHDAVGVDVSPLHERVERVDVMHICYPFNIADFVGESARYIERFRPDLTIVNSTVGIGTTRAIAERTDGAVVHSPVRGKHARMRVDRLEDQDPVVSGSYRAREADRNDLLRPHDRLGTRGREIL